MVKSYFPKLSFCLKQLSVVNETLNFDGIICIIKYIPPPYNSLKMFQF